MVCLLFIFFSSFVALAAFSIMHSCMRGMHCRVYTQHFFSFASLEKSRIFSMKDMWKKTQCIDDSEKKSFTFFSRQKFDELIMQSMCLSFFAAKKMEQKGRTGTGSERHAETTSSIIRKMKILRIFCLRVLIRRYSISSNCSEYEKLRIQYWCIRSVSFSLPLYIAAACCFRFCNFFVVVVGLIGVCSAYVV